MAIVVASVVYGVSVVALLLGALLSMQGESVELSMLGIGICVVGLVVALIGFVTFVGVM